MRRIINNHDDDDDDVCVAPTLLYLGVGMSFYILLILVLKGIINTNEEMRYI